jgi:hypothetical protein
VNSITVNDWDNYSGVTLRSARIARIRRRLNQRRFRQVLNAAEIESDVQLQILEGFGPTNEILGRTRLIAAIDSTRSERNAGPRI